MNKKLRLKIIERFGSQAEFSTHIPEDETVISRVVLGRRKLKPAKEKLWAEILGCRVGDIFTDASRTTNTK